ncbi:TonB-dependent receptor plug domain-containing protein [Massilia solisilvae]|uniref:TonB-dependent receptor plug domain-containing protein n=1 Tax=Massilia solisilvae TaxID=1811225 RepID=A0ABT2BID6_9BURK|nr:TonB-dependent receptor [Massilia solisilvae]MCS0608262.1 TonB-dependent receptor plug domain-containing protein [Massilia solisilvae]
MLRKTVVARALSIAFSTAALSAAVMQPAAAQSNAAGTVYGKVAPGSATSVVLRNLDTNQQRTVQVDASGSFTASALAIGRYRATLQGGSMNGQASEVEVIAGQGVEAVFVSGGVAKVEVTGRRSRIDVSSASNGATFTAKELAKLPVARNVDAIIQLAPNTTKSDPTYIAGASIGGGGPSENAYYINGMPVTNPLTQLGASELPFGAIATAEIKTGGYGAEFGRSVGGVVNITGKSGTNNWEVGALASTAPNRLRSKQKDAYFADTSANKGLSRTDYHVNEVTTDQLGAYVGGPIVKDKLFMFAAVENTKSDQHSINRNMNDSATLLANQGYRERMVKTLRYYTKFDWNITDEHRLEFTQLGDLPTVDTKYYAYDYKLHAPGGVEKSTMHEESPGTAAAPNGAEVQILRYTGNLTDNLTVTALGGRSHTEHITEPGGYDPTMPGARADAEFQAPGLNYVSPQKFTTLASSPSYDDVDFFRADLEYKLGSHTLRAGIDKIKVSSLHAGDVTAGGWTWTYGKVGDPTKSTPVPGGNIPAFSGNGPLAAQGYYVAKTISSTASDAFSKQSAQYIEDNWKVTKDLLVTIGVRNESFENQNSAHVSYLEQKNIIQPRASAVWDVNGDSSLKVFGSAGRYTVQMPTVVALRGANGSQNTSQYYSYTGTDKNGQPTGLTQLTVPVSANGEFGQPKDPKTVASLNLKPSRQDELTLGFEQAYSPSLNWGAKVTYRTLKSTIDDFCDGRPFRRYALAHGIKMAGEADFDPADNPIYPYFQCASFNPGEDQDFMIDYMKNGQYTKVHLTAAELGFEKPKRVYKALDLFVEHPYRNGWYGKLNYTLSRSTGNTEGQTLSDLNTGQGDVAATTTWDYSGIMRYANGLLPNDRLHQIKAFGFYDINQEWTVGGNLSIQSGRPRGCLGWDPNPASDPDWQQVGQSPNYGVEHFCFGKTWDQNVPAPRGTMGRLPWTKSLDLNLVYRPKVFEGLALKLDVFNVFNSQDVAKYNEQYNNGSGGVSVNYNSVSSYTPVRSMRLSAEFNHRF